MEHFLHLAIEMGGFALALLTYLRPRDGFRNAKPAGKLWRKGGDR